MRKVRVFDNLPALSQNGLLRPIHRHQWSSNKVKAMQDNATASYIYHCKIQTKSAWIGARGLEECLDLAQILFLQALPVDQWSQNRMSQSELNVKLDDKWPESVEEHSGRRRYENPLA